MGIMVGIREFRRDASQYLRRVRAGETITLTDRGEPFAEIRAVQAAGTALDQLIAGGHAKPATTNLAELLEANPPFSPERGERSLSDMVIHARAVERS